MHYLLYAQVPGFYAREWERRDPGRAAEPIVIHAERRVLDANAPAAKMGVRPNMGLDEAKAILQGSGLIVWEEEPYRIGQRRWLDVLCESSSTVEPDRQDSAWADLSGHPDPFDAALEFANRLAAAGEPLPQIGLGASKWVAKLACEQFGKASRPSWELAMRAAVESPERFLAPLPVVLMAPVDAAHRERLRFLGYRTIGEAATIPLRTLRSQFGPECERVRLATRGGPSEPIRAAYPLDSVYAGIQFEGGTNDSGVLAEALSAMAKRVASALSSRDAQGATIEWTIEFEQSTVVRRRTFARPIRTMRETAAALRLCLGAIEQPVFAIGARLPDLKKAQERQSDLYASRKVGDDLAASRAVDSLRRTFGDQSVVRASEIAVPRRIRVLRAWSHATGWQ